MNISLMGCDLADVLADLGERRWAVGSTQPLDIKNL
jgi:hypothetical protein